MIYDDPALQLPADLAPADLAPLRGLAEAIPCPACEVAAGEHCGTAPGPSHADRERAALELAAARALLWVDEFRGLAAIADRLDADRLRAELARILAPTVGDYLSGRATGGANP